MKTNMPETASTIKPTSGPIVTPTTMYTTTSSAANKMNLVQSFVVIFIYTFLLK